MFGLDAFKHRYGGKKPFGPNFDRDTEELPVVSEELADWQLDVPFRETPLTILCCPEDRWCRHEGCSSGRTMCTDCQLPMCHLCARSVLQQEPELPPGSLANDMMIYYGPEELYTHQMTVLEMICSSVCITSMICFSLEVKYGNLFMIHDRHMRLIFPDSDSSR